MLIREESSQEEYCSECGRVVMWTWNEEDCREWDFCPYCGEPLEQDKSWERLWRDQ